MVSRAEDLRRDVVGCIGAGKLVVVSNREPYTHSRDDGEVTWSAPPGGLVTALDPVMRACGGVWVAHGSGDADRETVDEHDRVCVPPDDPRYTLRRLWLTPREIEGYYDGFANSAIWPLCHVAYVRPRFRADDWRAYK